LSSAETEIITMSDENSLKPRPPVRSEDVAWEEWSEGSRFGTRYRHLTVATIGDAYKVGFAIEELAPGKQSCPKHYHMHEEEHVFILEGQLVLKLGDESHVMVAGDYVCFPAGQRAGHCMINESDSVCRYIIAGERNGHDVIVFPDTDKVMVRSLGKRQIFDMNARRDYWDGEDRGS
jgi:uncharacterized cupin superfamily protein